MPSTIDPDAGVLAGTTFDGTRKAVVVTDAVSSLVAELLPLWWTSGCAIDDSATWE